MAETELIREKFDQVTCLHVFGVYARLPHSWPELSRGFAGLGLDVGYVRLKSHCEDYIFEIRDFILGPMVRLVKAPGFA